MLVSLRFVVGCLFLAIAPIAIGATDSSKVTPARVLADIALHGPSKVVQKLYEPGGRWSSVMAKIAEGRDDWLKVAVALRPGTDGGASEELNETIFLALGAAPEAVLDLLKQRKFATEFVCSSNIAVDYSVDESRRFIEERLKALERVTKPSLAEIRTQCEQGLRNGLKDLERVGADQ